MRRFTVGFGRISGVAGPCGGICVEPGSGDENDMGDMTVAGDWPEKSL
jgi:hypothetical protein